MTASPRRSRRATSRCARTGSTPRSTSWPSAQAEGERAQKVGPGRPFPITLQTACAGGRVVRAARVRQGVEHRFEPGFPWFLCVARGGVRIYLSEHRGDASPGALLHLYVKDVDTVSAEFGIPVDEDGLAGRECHLVDPDGNRLRVATRRS